MSSESPATLERAAEPRTNRLAAAASPYLLQHAHNPVDWHEWGPEARERAQREGKPIFLSIGYAACHWCHVMAHESFEDPAVAAVLNEHFVNIKVDREERPDLDEIYMEATLALNQGQGGWPMSVWLTPDAKPFFAGTYFPPTARWGRPGFREVCERVAHAWRRYRSEIVATADQLAAAVQASLTPALANGVVPIEAPRQQAPAGGAPRHGLDLVDQAAVLLGRAFDGEAGGIAGGGPNKFPPSLALDVLLRAAVRRPADDPHRLEWLRLVELTLTRMAEGGIYDQLGGGLHRYSTDVEWRVPHFEKMLYDQALVSRSYLDAWRLTRRPLFARIAREICDYVLADLQAPEGGFYSSRDADSEGREGAYYVWNRDEVIADLGPRDGPLVCDYYDITALGNWNDPHEPGVVKSIPRALRSIELVARLHGVAPEELEGVVARGRTRLLELRARRTPPGLDDKVLCEWSGLMLGSLARAGAALAEPRFVDAAARAADFHLTHQCRDGRLHRAWRAGRTLGPAFIGDYGALIEGLLELHDATLAGRWLDAATMLTRAALAQFWDDAHGGFYFTAADHEPLIARSRDVRDNAVPSGNSLMLLNLLRLAALLDDRDLRRRAEAMLIAFGAQVARAPWAAERFLAGVDFAAAPPVEITFSGSPADPAAQALLRTVHETYLPNRILRLRAEPAPDGAAPGGRQPSAQICRNGACQGRLESPAELAALLAQAG